MLSSERISPLWHQLFRSRKSPAPVISGNRQGWKLLRHLSNLFSFLLFTGRSLRDLHDITIESANTEILEIQDSKSRATVQNRIVDRKRYYWNWISSKSREVSSKFTREPNEILHRICSESLFGSTYRFVYIKANAWQQHLHQWIVRRFKCSNLKRQ